MDDTTAEESTRNSTMDDALKHAEQLAAGGDTVASFDKVRTFWLTHPNDARAPRVLAAIVKKSGRDQLADQLTRLSDSSDLLEDDPQKFFDAGYELINERQFQLAAMLLERAVRLCPDEPVIRYELGFALMAIKRFADAIPHFEHTLQLAEDFDTHLNLSVCYTLQRDVEKSRGHLERLTVLAETTDTSAVGGKEEIQKELANRRFVLRRLELLSAKPMLNARDWYFILYGGLLLADQTLAGMAHADVSGNEMHKVAEAVLSMRGAMEAVGLEFDMIEYHSASARPLAESVGRLLDLPVEPISDFSRTDRTLLVVAWGEELIDSFRQLSRNDGFRTIFAYSIPKESPLPITPDIVAHIQNHCDLPWHKELEEYQERDQGALSLPDEAMAAIVDQLLIRCSEVESNPNVIRHSADLFDYFGSKRKLLIVGNQENIKERPEYTAELPIS